MPRTLTERLSDGWAQARKAGRTVAGGASEFISTHQHDIREGTSTAIDTIGRTTEELGKQLSAYCHDLKGSNRSPRVQKARSQRNSLSERATDGSLRIGLQVGKVLDRAGKGTRKASPAVGAATLGAITGTVGAVSGVVDSVAIQQSDIDALQVRLARAGRKARMRSKGEISKIISAHRRGQRKVLLDSLVIGGVTLSTLAAYPASVPPSVERAFEFAYPGLSANGESFADVVSRLPAENLVGFVNAVKGKLFEIELVAQLNNGGLPPGHHAELAGSANQQGYDIRIFDQNGNVVEFLQAKATDSVSYVVEGLNRYPSIDIVTTSEVHGQLLAMGLGERVSDGGMADAILQSKIEAAAGIDAGLGATDFVPSALGLAIIALSAFSNRKTDIVKRAAVFGERASKAGMSGGAGAVMMLATGTWLVAPLGGVGTRLLISHGEAKRQRFDRLERIVRSLEADNAAHAPNTAVASKADLSAVARSRRSRSRRTA